MVENAKGDSSRLGLQGHPKKNLKSALLAARLL